MAVTTLITKARPTNADVVAAIAELHGCVHAVGQDVSAIKSDVADVKERVAKVEGYNAGLASKFNLTTDGEARAGFFRRNRTPITILSALAAFATVVATYPALRVIWLAFDAYMAKSGAK